MDLKDIRKAINEIDDKIFELYKERMDLSAKVAKVKESQNLPITNKDREEEILARMSDKSEELKTYTRVLYNTLFSISKSYQNKLIFKESELTKSLEETVKGSIKGINMKYGLLGKTLGHSFSKYIHSQLGDYSYDFFEMEPNKIEELIKRQDIGGLNVTIPYKEEVMKYCDKITDRAKSIGCVNTLVYDEKRRLIGDNTDYFGFSYILDMLNLNIKDKFAIILGNGATSKTVAAVLKDRGVSFIKISRNQYPYFSDMFKYKDAEILINATPVGMYPNNGDTLVDLKKFTSLKVVIDVIYNPLLTKLLLDAKKLKIPYSDGLPMLVAQGAKASEIFMKKKVSDEDIKSIIGRMRYDFGNIILIGMPGAGKTTIGAEIASISGRKFIDIDQSIEEKASMKIQEIFEKYGEPYFRQLESEVVEEFGKESGLVIATGGGVVTREENYSHLAQNGRIYLIERDLDKLEINGRPLSKDIDAVKKLGEKREDSYHSFSDYAVKNEYIKKAAEEILEEYKKNTIN